MTTYRTDQVLLWVALAGVVMWSISYIQTPSIERLMIALTDVVVVIGQLRLLDYTKDTHDQG